MQFGSQVVGVSAKGQSLRFFVNTLVFFGIIHIGVPSPVQARGDLVLKDAVLKKLADEILKGQASLPEVQVRIDSLKLNGDLKEPLVREAFRKVLIENSLRRIQGEEDYDRLEKNLKGLTRSLRSIGVRRLTDGMRSSAFAKSLVDLLNFTYSRLLQIALLKYKENHSTTYLEYFLKEDKEAFPYLSDVNLLLIREGIEAVEDFEERRKLLVTFFSSIFNQLKEKIVNTHCEYQPKVRTHLFKKYLRLSPEWVSHGITLLETTPLDQEDRRGIIIAVLFGCEGLPPDQEARLVNLTFELSREKRFEVFKYFLGYHSFQGGEVQRILNDILTHLPEVQEAGSRLRYLDWILRIPFPFVEHHFYQIATYLRDVENSVEGNDDSGRWDTIIQLLAKRLPGGLDQQAQNQLLTFFGHTTAGKREELLKMILELGAGRGMSQKKALSRLQEVLRIPFVLSSPQEKNRVDARTLKRVVGNIKDSIPAILDYLDDFGTEKALSVEPSKRLTSHQQQELIEAVVQYLIKHPDLSENSRSLVDGFYEFYEFSRLAIRLVKSQQVSGVAKRILLTRARENQIDSNLLVGRMLALFHLSSKVEPNFQSHYLEWIESNFSKYSLEFARIAARNPSLTPENQMRLFQILVNASVAPDHKNYWNIIWQKRAAYIDLLKNPNLTSEVKIKILEVLLKSEEVNTSLEALVIL